jgi:hypothetical protein
MKLNYNLVISQLKKGEFAGFFCVLGDITIVGRVQDLRDNKNGGSE